MLSSHREENLFERVRVIIDKSQDTTEAVYKMMQELPVDIKFNAINFLR